MMVLLRLCGQIARVFNQLLSCYTRRSPTLRTYAGDTSLPGGRWDPEDRNLEETAVRAPWFRLSLSMFNYHSAGKLSKKYVSSTRSERQQT
jgi:hypothetical protein